jgi:solute carrier family 30 (zinc transporter), member 9
MECDLSHRAVNMALWCNFLVFSLKFGVWISTSSHVMLAEMIHSIADFANQVTLSFTMALYMFMPFFLFYFVNKLIIQGLFIKFQALLAYGLRSSRRAPDAIHPCV